MPITLEMKRYGETLTETFDSVKEAAVCACAAVEWNTAAPSKLIDEKGQIVWENTGPFDGSYDCLRKIAVEGLCSEGCDKKTC